MKEKILEYINRNHPVTARILSSKFKISPQGIHKHLKKLLEEGHILKQGTSRKTTSYIPHSSHALRTQQDIQFKAQFQNKGLQEDQIFKEMEQKIPFLRLLPENTIQILYYAFTEMMNNAMDHSHSEKITVRWSIKNNKILFEIEDKGIGIFKNIQEKKHLLSDMEAIQDLLKGKQTTQPSRHSGEGIFFTSKIADLFIIESHRKMLTFNSEIPDLFIRDNIRNKLGTLVHFEINRNTSKTLTDLFREYTNEDFEFEKTQAKVALYTQGGLYISRSQAKRLLHGLSRFKKIILDFSKVDTIGQGFADEVFRIFRKEHPEIEIIPQNMHENVEFMVKRAKANA